MVYVCENCGVLFSRASKQDHCPGCGKNLIRAANSVERHEYAAHIAETIQGRCADGPGFPNMVITDVFVPKSFAFMLPAAALQVDSDMVMEICVEYGENAADHSDLTANVWVRQADGVRIDFLMSVHLPMEQCKTSEEQLDRVFSALSGNAAFTAKLRSYIMEQLKRGRP